MSRYPEHPGSVPSDTSEAAADSVAHGADSMRAMVFKAIRDAGQGGMTCDEVEVQLRMRHQTASARIRELVLFGRIHDSGGRRETRSGRLANVYLVGKKPDQPTVYRDDLFDGG